MKNTPVERKFIERVIEDIRSNSSNWKVEDLEIPWDDWGDAHTVFHNGKLEIPRHANLISISGENECVEVGDDDLRQVLYLIVNPFFKSYLKAKRDAASRRNKEERKKLVNRMDALL